MTDNASEPVPSEPALPALTLGRHEGREAFANLVRQSIAVADVQAWREWWWCDDDFSDWPLGERAVAEALDRWAGQGRRLRLLARNYEGMRERHARFVTWRVRWDHCIEARACASASADDFPSGMWMPDICWSRIDTVRSVVLCSSEPRSRVQMQQNLQEWWAKASPSFPASSLGL